MGREGKIFTETIHTGTETSNGTGSSSSVPSNHVTAELRVLAASGTTPTLDVVLQESVLGVKWTDLITFTQAVAITFELAKAANPARFLRLKWTVGGTTPSFTFTVDLVRDLLPRI